MLKKRLNNKKGFTLAELLIAVAIIGILVAVSVPVFTSKLGQAKTATDEANIRAARAAAVAIYLEDGLEEQTVFYYDAAAGVLVPEDDKSEVKTYGQGEGHNVIKVTIETNGTVDATWE